MKCSQDTTHRSSVHAMPFYIHMYLGKSKWSKFISLITVVLPQIPKYTDVLHCLWVSLMSVTGICII